MRQISKIYSIPDNEFINIVESHNSFYSILRDLGLSVYGGHNKTLRKRIQELNLDTTHIKQRRYHHELGRNTKNKLENILVIGSKYNRGHLKERLIKEGIIDNKCSICGNNGVWNNKKLSLQLDHINGIADDNRLENLRLLCPNCHSQTDTFGGKNIK